LLACGESEVSDDFFLKLLCSRCLEVQMAFDSVLCEVQNESTSIPWE
jgi:hypothetical protein